MAKENLDIRGRRLVMPKKDKEEKKDQEPAGKQPMTPELRQHLEDFEEGYQQGTKLAKKHAEGAGDNPVFDEADRRRIYTGAFTRAIRKKREADEIEKELGDDDVPPR